MRTEAVQTTLKPHEELLRACVAASASETGRAAVSESLTNERIEWPRLLVDAVRHGVAQHAASVLLGCGESDAIPCEIRACLFRLTQANARRNAVLLDRLGRLVDTLESSGIPCVVLKGAALAVTVYATPALRPFADLDILVPNRDFARAGEIAEQLGFRREGAEPHAEQAVAAYRAEADEDILSATMVPEYDSAVTDEILRRDGRAIKLEIHRTILRYPTGFARPDEILPFWEHVSPSECADASTGTPSTSAARKASLPTLTPEAALAHTCIHAAGHGFNRLLFALDALMLIECHPELDWERVADLSAGAGGDSVPAMLGLLRESFGLELPPAAVRLLDSSAPASRIALPEVYEAMGWSKRELFWRQLRTAPLRERLILLRQAAFPPLSVIEEVHGATHPGAQALLRIGRPFRLLWHLAQMKAAAERRQGNPTDAPARREARLAKGTENS